MNILTKDGLTGSSGLNVANLSGIFHIIANYAAGAGRVFVLTRANQKVPNWKRMTRRAAKKAKRQVIPCSYCRRPATSLDHYWPYHSEANHCAYHRNWNELCQAKEGE